LPDLAQDDETVMCGGHGSWRIVRGGSFAAGRPAGLDGRFIKLELFDVTRRIWEQASNLFPLDMTQGYEVAGNCPQLMEAVMIIGRSRFRPTVAQPLEIWYFHLASEVLSDS
jgi:hypothetical protein